jgi:hypothetical protein
MAQISPLRRRMLEDMTVRNLSPATQQSYLNAVLTLGQDTVPERIAHAREPNKAAVVLSGDRSCASWRQSRASKAAPR